ncbi:reverse transcriptase zinc-binding domain-containing protein [Artemisia annua]|uniref:Reverse transcriptase zinc-binding domain-containing protein n=1 Tax=Artemisia annua TaxID=35608 RepID=A0A2U1NHE4_ARTAN|nr:reverse transcriptase zinc-binding domain-containing protein [Artemisia annua]
MENGTADDEAQRKTTSHLFTGCMFAAEIWSRMETWCRLSPIFAFEVVDLLTLADVQQLSKTNKYILKGILITALWALWNERNNRVFKNNRRRAIEVVEFIKATSFFWIRNRSKYKEIDWNAWRNSPLLM